MSSGHGNTEPKPPEVRETEKMAERQQRDRDAAEKRVKDLTKKLKEM